MPFTVGPNDSNVQGLASWDTGDVSVKLISPTGAVSDAGTPAPGQVFTTDPNYTAFALTDPAAGTWQVQVTAGSTASVVDVNVQVFKRQGYIDPGGPSPNPDPACRHDLTLGA